MVSASFAVAVWITSLMTPTSRTMSSTKWPCCSKSTADNHSLSTSPGSGPCTLSRTNFVITDLCTAAAPSPVKVEPEAAPT
eukprot:4165692-Pyramimonas_sp.AAC.2